MSDNPWLIYIAAEVTAETLPKSIKRMYYLHRFAKGKVCRDCQFLERFYYHNNTYFKCNQYGITHGAATDWRLHWSACGLYQEKDASLPEN
jgi:hypothetical protein